MKILKELGHGFKGTVYLVEINKKQYAYKIEKILDIPKQEIAFSKFANKYPNQFITLYDYEIIENCNHIQKIDTPLKSLPDKVVAKIQKLRKSKLCFARLYSLVDTTLDTLTISKPQIYSMLIQLSYISYLLGKHHYLYGDMNPYNVGVIKTDKRLKILNRYVPTLGYQFKLIDFGTVRKSRSKWFELNQVICFYLINGEYDKETHLRVSKTDEYKALDIKDSFLRYTIFTVLYYDKYKLKKPILKCDIEDILFLINHNIYEIIEYFMKKIKTI